MLIPRQVGAFKSKNASPNDAIFVPAGLDSFKEIELQVPFLQGYLAHKKQPPPPRTIIGT